MSVLKKELALLAAFVRILLQRLSLLNLSLLNQSLKSSIRGIVRCPLKYTIFLKREGKSMVYSAFSFLLRKNPPMKQISIATPATIADPTMPDTVVPAADSLPGNA